MTDREANAEARATCDEIEAPGVTFNIVRLLREACDRFDRADRRVAELEAENARLREQVELLTKALRGLQYFGLPPGEPERFCDHAAEPCRRCAAARAALEVKP